MLIDYLIKIQSGPRLLVQIYIHRVQLVKQRYMFYIHFWDWENISTQTESFWNWSWSIVHTMAMESLGLLISLLAVGQAVISTNCPHERSLKLWSENTTWGADGKVLLSFLIEIHVIQWIALLKNQQLLITFMSEFIFFLELRFVWFSWKLDSKKKPTKSRVLCII